MPDIDRDICKGCNLCVEFCPKKVFAISKSQNKNGYPVPAVKSPTKCTGCGLCELMCPDFAIDVGKDAVKKQKMKPSGA